MNKIEKLEAKEKKADSLKRIGDILESPEEQPINKTYAAREAVKLVEECKLEPTDLVELFKVAYEAKFSKQAAEILADAIDTHRNVGVDSEILDRIDEILDKKEQSEAHARKRGNLMEEHGTAHEINTGDTLSPEEKAREVNKQAYYIVDERGLVAGPYLNADRFTKGKKEEGKILVYKDGDKFTAQEGIAGAGSKEFKDAAKAAEEHAKRKKS